MRDYAEVKARGTIDADVAGRALAMLEVDPQGLDLMDRKLLEAIIHKFDGGPVGVDSLAAAIGEERDTIEDVIEPYLIQHGYLQRTPRGRTATLTTWRHLADAARRRGQRQRGSVRQVAAAGRPRGGTVRQVYDPRVSTPRSEDPSHAA